MDVIASFKAGVHHAVASMGTALTRDQIKAMKRLTSNITLVVMMVMNQGLKQLFGRYV
jgi:DNA primase